MEMFNDKVAEQLKTFARQCIDDPSLLYDPKLSFIKDLIEHYGGKVPEAKTNSSSDTKTEFESKPAEPQAESEPASEESEESDLELDMTGVIGLYIYPFEIICLYVVYNKYKIMQYVSFVFFF